MASSYRLLDALRYLVGQVLSAFDGSVFVNI